MAEKKNGKKNGKAIGKSLTPEQREVIADTIPTLTTRELEIMSEKIDDAQKLSKECCFREFENIDFSKITPACCRWVVKLLNQEIAEREELTKEFYEEEY